MNRFPGDLGADSCHLECGLELNNLLPQAGDLFFQLGQSPRFATWTLPLQGDQGPRAGNGPSLRRFALETGAN